MQSAHTSFIKANVHVGMQPSSLLQSGPVLIIVSLNQNILVHLTHFRLLEVS